MKRLKNLVTLNVIFAAMLSFAGHNDQCTGPCDNPKPAPCRRRVDARSVKTDTLFVRDNAQVCGDLTVNGIIHNLELQLLRDCAVPPTDEVYNEFRFLQPMQPILENIEEFSIPRSLVVPGTEIYPDAPIYGYNTNQTLDLTGGPDKSYNNDFEAVNVRYHGQNPQELVLTTPENMQSWYERAVSFYAQRGLPLPGIDVYPQYEGQFIFQNDDAFVAIKFHFEEGSLVPTALDLVSTNAGLFTALELFEPDPNVRKNGRYYPLRIPVTTNFTEFNQKFGKEPIVYFDNLHRKITIHVPACTTFYELSKFDLLIPQSECEVNILYTDNLLAFDGTFSLMRRNALNQLVSSSFADAQYLIQASPTVTYATKFIEFDTPETIIGQFHFTGTQDLFTGLSIPMMNGGSPISDVFTYNSDNVNAASLATDPFILPELAKKRAVFQEGDNPVTTLVENYASSVANNFLDSIQWFYVARGLPEAVIQGLTVPEENPFLPLPTFVDPKKLLTAVVGHEMMHNAHTLSGVTKFTPTEGQSTALEMDPRLNDNVFLTFRTQSWGGNYMPYVVRGDWPLTAPEINAPTSTYGSSIFWYYVASQFDYNYQVMRRMNDIITHQSFGPLLEENGVPFANTALISGTLGYNPAGALLALNKALFELHGKRLKNVFSNYAISLAMLRNNTSIPPQYRHYYPYWLASTTYPGFEELAFLTEPWATWWQDYQENIILPEGYTNPDYEGQPFVPVLDQDIINYDMQDMTMLIVEIPVDVSTVTVDVAAGEWRLSILQFTSDGTEVGEFLIDGPHANNGGITEFDISQFTGAGYVRLVAAHVSIHNYGGLQNFCEAEPFFTGRISIYPS